MGRDRILVTGGGTFTGNHVTAALLAMNASVRLLVRPGAEETLGPLADDVEWHTGDLWNPASLKGRARGMNLVIHTVGGMHAAPERGLTHHYLNVLSLRNAANMCVSDGVSHLMLISAANAPWMPRGYIRAKREAEQYMARVGLHSTIIRTPLLYQRGQPRSPLMRLLSLNPLMRRSAPMPVDVFAWAAAKLAVNGADKTLYYAGDLWRLNTRDQRRGLPYERSAVMIEEPPLNEGDTEPNVPVA